MPAMKVWRETLWLMCLLMFAPPAYPQSASGSIPSMGDQPGFVWLLRPSALPFDLFYPEPANDQSVVGRVALECAPRTDQRADCNVSSEAPVGWGFANAALGVSRSFRMQPNMRDGHVIGSPHGHLNLGFAPYHNDQSPVDRLDLPLWEAAPNADAVLAAWPEGKAHPDARGRATLSCTVDSARALSCRLVRETQPDLGLGRAALALVSQFRVAESDTSFLERHRDTPFLLPVNFGLPPKYEPLDRFTAGETPVRVPDPPRAVVEMAYPQAARGAHISGVAMVTCTMRASGPATCVVTSETPSGAGFGSAALLLANTIFENLALLPGSWEESMPGDQFEIEVPFDLTPSAQPAADATH